MNAHEGGRRLGRVVTGTLGVMAVIAASVLGLHDWADTLATKDAATSQIAQPSTAGAASASALENIVSDSPGAETTPEATTSAS